MTGRDFTMISKSNTVAIAAVLAVLATPAVTIPAFARASQAPTWDTCFTLAVQRGSGPNKGGSEKVMSQYTNFMDQCVAGRIPLSADASNPAAKSPARAHAPTVASKHV